MKRALLLLLWIPVIQAQPKALAPIDAAIQAYWPARNSGQFTEAAAHREEARRLLESVPATEPRLMMWVRNVTQLYDGSGMTARARSILESTLARAGDSSRLRGELLNSLGDSWEQDRNLLKAVSYREQALTALEAARPESAPEPPFAQRTTAVLLTGAISVKGRFSQSLAQPGNAYLYLQLAALYRRLGRPDAVAAIPARIIAHVHNPDNLLADFYQQSGQLDQAAAILKKHAQQATDPQEASTALQQLAYVYQRQQRFADAAAAIEQAIAQVKDSSSPATSNQLMWMRQNAARFLQQAGQTEAADRLFEASVAEAPDNMRAGALSGYADYLAQSDRAPQAETLLNDYLTSHPELAPEQQAGVLYSMANAARLSGDPKRAEALNDAALAKRPQPQPPSEPFMIGKLLEQANAAAQSKKIDEAVRLATGALDQASAAVDRESAIWAVTNVASALAMHNAADRADMLYQRLFNLVESWSSNTLQPLTTVEQNYVRYLNQQQRWTEVPAALERYRNTLVDANGAGTGRMEEALRLTFDIANSQQSHAQALTVAQEMVALEESLSGNTSEPYLNALETLAQAREQNGDRAGSLPLRTRAIEIADLVYGPDDLRRALTRMTAAWTFANQRQFAEAEKLAAEAIEIGAASKQSGNFTNQLAQIRQIEAAAAKSR